MPTNANTFNSRVTSEALEAKFRQVFPAQGGAELVQDLFASGVIQPVVDFSQVAEGSILPPNLQTAWDFSTGSIQITSTSPTTIISNTGFWQVDLTYTGYSSDVTPATATVDIYDGSTYKAVWAFANEPGAFQATSSYLEGKFVVFLRAGDTLTGSSQSGSYPLNVWYRQIADVNGNLINPLGFTFS